jgi:hypothetical protein
MYTRDRGVQLTWVHQQIYAGGGDHIPIDWEAFRDQTGISAILHLNPVEPVIFQGPAPSAYLWMNIDHEREIDQNNRWQAGTFVQSCVSTDHRVLIHSGRGRHRVRWIYVAYLILSGSSIKGAISEVEEKPWLSPYHTDPREWQKFHQNVKSRSTRGN